MQTIPFISDAALIPESYQMRLMAWRDEFTRGYFEIGDIANEIVLVNIQKGMKIEQAMIYAAIGRFCGKSGRTVRDYSEISAFFPDATRRQYDMLPFSHFRFAKSCGTNWEQVLEFSMEHPDASEERLAHEFSSLTSVAAYHPAIIMNADLSPEAVAATFSSVAANESSVAASVATSPSVAAGLSGIYALANLVSQAEIMMSSWEMQKPTRLKLILALDGLKDVLKELCDKNQALKYDYETARPQSK